METLFDVRAVREQFPALDRTYNGRRVAYLDGPGGSQVAQRAIDAVAGYMTAGGANLHGAFVTSRETEELISETRHAVARFLGAEADEIAFGYNMTTLALAISRALGGTWEQDSEIVVTEIDHRANVDPWTLAAADAGARTRWVAVDPETLTLDLGDLDEKINERTRLVAVNLASNAVGTVSDVAEIARRAHEVGAVVAVDAVHAAAHIPIDRDTLGADILLCSAYKFFGPHVGIAAIRRELFEDMEVYKLGPGPAHISEKLETGTQNHEGLAGVKEAIAFIASLGSDPIAVRTQAKTISFRQPTPRRRARSPTPAGKLSSETTSGRATRRPGMRRAARVTSLRGRFRRQLSRPEVRSPPSPDRRTRRPCVKSHTTRQPRLPGGPRQARTPRTPASRAIAPEAARAALRQPTARARPGQCPEHPP